MVFMVGDPLVRRIVYVLLLLFLSATAACGQQPAGVALPDDYEIQDVRNLPQDFRMLAPFRAETAPGKACRDSMLAEFRRQYFLPWSTREPLSDISRTVKTMEEHGKGTWYGSNKRKVSQKSLDALAASCDLGHFPALNRMAVALVPTAMRVLPTLRPFYKKAGDFPFDDLQNSELKVNEPIKVLHLSKDGNWAFVETADANGWVEFRDIGYVDEGLVEKRMAQVLVVAVSDTTSVRDDKVSVSFGAKLGTLFPVVREDGCDYDVAVLVPDRGHRVREVVVRLPGSAVRRFPLALTGETVAMVGNQLIDKPYGWGELFHDRDCSALMRDFFMPFGIWLPRGSYNQIHAGRVISLAGLTGPEKERVLVESGVPYLTLVYLRGHIMLYVGAVNGRPLVFHSLWGVTVTDGNGGREKQVVGKSIISTLVPGSELPLANGSLLDMVRSIGIQNDRCPATDP